DAKAPGAARQAMMRGPMMQRALEDRFHLRVHRETRTVPVLALMLTDSKPKLRSVTEEGCTPVTDDELLHPQPTSAAGRPWCGTVTVQRNGAAMIWEGHGITLDLFCKFMNGLERPVVNRTGLEGAFDIRLE